ncbi:nucleotide sugar dehydrogenase [Gammaproteobacteria bacterium]|nr:nucleotide sugar dehydrogenase [Gammaproteobacteria bacterium]
MKKYSKKDYKICIVGLGYVGLPLAARFTLKGFNVTGFDTKEERVNQLINKIDVNDDMSHENLENLSKNAKLTTHVNDIKESNIFIVTVPTPINEDKTPNLAPLISASELVGSVMKKNSIVIYESTVYPGVTDNICTPILEEKSKLIFNEDFSTGYSPERIVPGDKVNTIEKIKKIVSASNQISLNIISFLYSSIIDAGIHQASSIKVAEAAKVTENIQRDVNIALINEMHQLYSSLDISTNDVIEAAATKWNFMKLKPGLVGGHCISIDPYYLMHKSKMSGYTPNIMLAARKLNDEMGDWVVDNFLDFAKNQNIDLASTTVTLMGYTFKENCSDIRNTKVHDLAISLKNSGVSLNIWDPFLTKETQEELNKNNIQSDIKCPQDVQLAFICVYHKQILKFLETYGGKVYDFKNLNSSL